MTVEAVDRIIANGKVLAQNGGEKFAYVAREGVVVVTKTEKLVTTWSDKYFDENMVEIVKKLFGE